jgi:RNA polymerase sigma-70 factor, ECF subfamily
MVTSDWQIRLSDPFGAVARPAEGGHSVASEAAAAAGGAAAAGAEPTDTSEQLIESWFRDHFSRLWRLVARLGVASHSIDDIVQDAFITANRRQADIREGREWSFLVGTAVRLSQNQRARASVRREVIEPDVLAHEPSSLPDAEQLLIEKRVREQLDRALATLSDAHRAVFVLYELEGFSAPEIAEALGLRLGTVASRLGRARAKFSETAARMQRAHSTRSDKP